MSVYLYGEQGARLQKQETLPAEYTEEELLGLAVQLRQAADYQRRWDADIRLLAADGSCSGGEAIQQFLSHGESYAAIRQRRMPLAQNAIVSRKILDEGWKVGYMERTEPTGTGQRMVLRLGHRGAGLSGRLSSSGTCAGGDCMAAV
ncbi:MAG: hypothetical protein V8Q30_13435 [Acutalibacteraceae bacterium]